MALGKTPSELEQTLTIDDYYFFVSCVAVEPLPSAKIDIAQGLIRRDLKAVLSPKMPSDLVMSWDKINQIKETDLSLEEQAKRAIERIRNQNLGIVKTQKYIKKIEQKLAKLKEQNKDKDS